MHALSLYAVAVLFVGTGVAHVLWPSVFVRIMPPYLPRPLLLIYLSGIAEVIGGLGVLVPALRVYAGWGLLLLLCAVFPVHVYMARHPEVFSDIPLWALYLRLPLQFVLMAWVYWAACRGRV